MRQKSPIDQQTLRKILIAMILQQQMQAQKQGVSQSAQAQQPNSVGKTVEALKKAKGVYDDAKTVYKAGSDIYSGLSGAGKLTEASNAAWNAAAGEASQAAWNSAANAATAAEGGSAAATSAAGQTPTNYAGWAAAGASALDSAQKVLDKNARDEQQAYDAAMAVPRAVAAYYTAGLSNVAEGFARKQWGGTMKKLDKFNQTNPMSPVFIPMQASRLWTSDKWKTEGNRLKNLQQAGVDIPEWAQARIHQTRGVKKDELINKNHDINFQGATKDGFVDNLFENTRDESKMAPETMQRYAVWAEKRPDWFKLSDAQRRAATLAARDAGALREHHGTLDINDQIFNQQAFDKAIASAPAAQQQAQQRQQQAPSRYILKNGELVLKKGMK